MEGDLCQEGIAKLILKYDESSSKICVEWIKPAQDTGSCECGNERSGSIKGWKILVFCSAIISRSRKISMHLHV
jgi:hypothetical protein